MAADNWQRVAVHINEIGFGNNQIAEVKLGGRKLCLAHHAGKLYAFAHKCPHAGGPMADGYIDALGNVVCPLHRYKFSMSNGHNVSGEGYFLRCWPVEIREDGIYVDMPRSRGWLF